MMDAAGDLHMTDFGLAQAAGKAELWPLAPTPAFCPPELMGTEPVSVLDARRIDAWPLGICAIAMLTGIHQSPFNVKGLHMIQVLADFTYWRQAFVIDGRFDFDAMLRAARSNPFTQFFQDLAICDKELCHLVLDRLLVSQIEARATTTEARDLLRALQPQGSREEYKARQAIRAVSERNTKEAVIRAALHARQRAELDDTLDLSPRVKKLLRLGCIGLDVKP